VLKEVRNASLAVVELPRERDQASHVLLPRQLGRPKIDRRRLEIAGVSRLLGDRGSDRGFRRPALKPR
jgi:hypothetical protein